MMRLFSFDFLKSNISRFYSAYVSPLQDTLLKESCIIVDENDNLIGQRTKKDCHLVVNINNGLLHRAFSVLLFNNKNEFLLTQRSKFKITFPNYFTNSCCSHPLFTQLELDEKNAIGVKRAAQRRMFLELGIEPASMPLTNIHYMTRILYKFAPENETWGEFELDYLLVVKDDFKLKPNPDEVQKMEFVPKEDLEPYLDELENSGQMVSPWFKLIHDNFLYKYWNNLDNLNKCTDHTKIHRFI